jgi:EmrB/QacA subfamily drug resistance transporter
MDNMIVGNEYTGKKAVLISVLVTNFVSTFSGSALNLAVPQIAFEFETSASTIGWLVTAYLLAATAFSVPFGRIADISGRRPLYLAGIAIFAASSGLIYFSTSFVMVLILRLAQGVSGAMIFSTNTAILLDAYPANMRGRVLGYSSAMIYVGLSLGPVFGGLLTHNFGWRSVFIVNFIVSATAFFVAFAGIPKNAKTDRGSQESVPRGTEMVGYDVPGMILYSLTMLFILYGFTIVSDGIVGFALIGVGVLLLIVFLRHESRTEHPALEVRLFKNVNFLLSNLAALLNYGATFATGYLVSIYLQIIMSIDAQSAGLIMICQPAFMALIAPFAGKLSDKYSPYKLSSIGMALCSASLASYIFLETESSLVHVIINLVLIGIGFGFFSAPNTNAIMSNVKPADFGVASSLTASMRSLGQVSSMAIITIIMNSNLAGQTLHEAGPETLISVLRISFTIFTGICLIGIIVSFGRKTKK